MKGWEAQEQLDALIRGVPRELLVLLFKRKLEEAGLEPSESAVETLCELVLRGDIQSDADVEPPGVAGESKITIAITDEDIRELHDAFGNLIEKIPELVETVSSWAGSEMAKELKKRWPDHLETKEAEYMLHGSALGEYWADALEDLEILLEAVREQVLEKISVAQRSRAKRNLDKRETRLRLAARACNITEEIIVLLSVGYPDAAFARWRTLHEIVVVALFLDAGGNDLSQRYLDHDVVESSKSLQVYVELHEQIGARAPSKSDQQRVAKGLDRVVKLYGAEFTGDYGWAAKELGKKRPTFKDIEAAIDQSFRRHDYRLASTGIHAGVRAASSSLGLLTEKPILLMGPSIIGLEFAGVNAAISLGIIFGTLNPTRCNMDDLVILKTVHSLQEQCRKSMSKAARRTRRAFGESRGPSSGRAKSGGRQSQ